MIGSLTRMYPVTVTGDRLTLREFADADVDAVLEIYGDSVVTEHLSFEPRSRDQVIRTLATVAEAAQAEPRTEYSLAAALTTTGQVIGFARLAVDTQHPGQSSGQLGFALRKDHWGQHLGEEMVQLLLRLGFDILGLHRLWGARSPANTTSDNLMRKLGMIEEGRIRHHLRIRGQWRDSIVHSILEDEWRAGPSHADG
jgi:RimJ/RimL family protein N-acetyltransferase